MKKRSGAVLLTAVILLLAATGAAHKLMDPHSRVYYQHMSCAGEDEDITGSGEDGVLCSHLPLMIIDTGGEKIPGQDREDKRELLCRYRIINEDSGENRSDASPSDEGYLTISIRGNSSRNLDKKQYAVKLTDSEGSPQAASLMGMPAETSWTLNGSQIDHSLMRNYLGYGIADEIMGTAPECRMCELMMTDEKGDTVYAGFYLATEKPKVSKERVSLTAYNADYTETSFMLQQTYRITENRIDHLSIDDAWPEPYELIYPDPDMVTLRSARYVQSEIYRVEKMLRDASRTGQWKDVRKEIDYDSFASYYLINEFFQNYDAGRGSTYIYRNLGGKIHMGPVWDFDGAFDNFAQQKVSEDELRLRKQFYFRQLFNDPEFAGICVHKYNRLRKSTLSEEYLLDLITGTEEYIGSAADRNAQRWGYEEDEDLKSSAAELREYVKTRGEWMDEHFEEYCTVIDWKESY